MDPVPPRIRFGQFTLDTRSGELTDGTHRVLLADQPFRLLMLLVRAGGAVVPRDAVRQALWSDDTFVDFEAGLHAAVKRLREALGDSASSPRFVETLPRRGYRFVAPVQVAADAAPVSAASGPATAETASAPPLPAAHPRYGRAAVTVLAGVLVAGAAIAVMLNVSRPSDAGPGGTDGSMRRLTNLGTVVTAALSPDGRDLAYVARDGVRESLWRGATGTDAVRLLGPLEASFVSVTYGPDGFVYYTLFSPDRTGISLQRVAAPGGAPETLLDASGPIAFSPDGTRYARIHNLSMALRESRVLVTERATGATRVLSVRHSPESFVMLKPAWSPDGARLLVFGASDARPGRIDLVAIEAATGSVARVADVPLAHVDGALWPPGEGELLVAGREMRAAPQRVWSISTTGGGMRPLTDDVSDYSLVGFADAATRIVAVRHESTRSLWTAEAAAPERAIRLAADAGSGHRYDEIAWTPAGRVIYTHGEGGNADLWSVDAVTQQRTRLTTDPADDYTPAASPDGSLIVFGSSRRGGPGLWAMAADGSGQRRLTTGGDSRPSFSPDGRWVAFQRAGVETTPYRVHRVWLATGAVEPVAPAPTIRPAVSPDGRFVAHYWMTPERWVMAVTPADGGIAAAMFGVGPAHIERVLQWAPGGRTLAYIDGQGGAANIWLQALDGGPPRPLTRFTDGRIASFAWSPDGTRLAWMRVDEVGDVVGVVRRRRES